VIAKPFDPMTLAASVRGDLRPAPDPLADLKARFPTAPVLRATPTNYRRSSAEGAVKRSSEAPMEAVCRMRVRLRPIHPLLIETCNFQVPL